jgi:hypothetical protein
VIIRDAIEGAESKHEVFFPLTSYIEAVRHLDQLNLLPWAMRNLPLAGIEDVKTRIASLHLNLQYVTSPASTRTYSLIEDAISVYQTALCRTTQLQSGDDLPHAA